MTVDPARRFFEDYVADRRRQVIASFVVDDVGDLVRYSAIPPRDEGFVVFATLAPGTETRRIRAEVRHFRESGQAFEWKVYAFDTPHDLEPRLAGEGFTAGEAETFMVFALDEAVAPAVRASKDIEIRRIDDRAGIDDVIAVQEAVWAMGCDWLRPDLETVLGPDAPLSIFCAYRDDRSIGAGWIDYPVGSRYPELHGGSVVEDARGRGVYAALFAVRRDEAATRGYRQLTVDASSMSRPILERLGFRAICRTVPMRWACAQTTQAGSG